MMHVSLNAHRILDYLPRNSLPYMPGKIKSQFIFQVHNDRKHYCSPECFDTSFNDYICTLSPESNNLSKSFEAFTELEDEWSELLPSVPPELLLRALCLEVLAVNPKLEYRPNALPLRKKLRVLTKFKASTDNLNEFEELFGGFSDLVQVMLKPVMPFSISPETIKDSVQRILANAIHFHLNSPRPIDIYLAAASKDEKERSAIDKVEADLINSGSGNIKAIWHPSIVCLYENISSLKKSHEGNAAVSMSDISSSQVDLVAVRDIARGEEILLHIN